jgi:hypothetical protein
VTIGVLCGGTETAVLWAGTVLGVLVGALAGGLVAGVEVHAATEIAMTTPNADRFLRIATESPMQAGHSLMQTCN